MRFPTGRMVARTAVSRALKPSGAPWIGRRWLSVLLVPWGRRG